MLPIIVILFAPTSPVAPPSFAVTKPLFGFQAASSPFERLRRGEYSAIESIAIPPTAFFQAELPPELPKGSLGRFIVDKYGTPASAEEGKRLDEELNRRLDDAIDLDQIYARTWAARPFLGGPSISFRLMTPSTRGNNSSDPWGPGFVW